MVNGTGDRDCLGWAGRLCAAANYSGHCITYYNLGIRGETSADIGQRWSTEVGDRLAPDMDGRVIFSFGINDTTFTVSNNSNTRRVQLSDSLHYTRQILEQAMQRYPVLMISPPPIGEEKQNQRILELVEAIAPLCNDLAIPYLDVFTPLMTSTYWRQEANENDGAHPGVKGYQEFANLVSAWTAWQSWLMEDRDRGITD